MKSLIPLLLACSVTAQAGAFGGPQYGYNSSGQIVDFTAVPYGSATNGTTVLYTSQHHGASMVFIVEGASLAFISLPFGATLYVGNIVNTTPAVLVAGTTWVSGRAIPLNPSLIGLTYFAQFAHFFPAHYVGSHGIQVTIQ